MPDDNTPLEDDQEHGGVDDDALEAAAAARFAATTEPPADPTAEPPVEDGDLPAPSSAGVDDDDDNVWEFDVGGETLKINREQAQAYAEFEAFLAANPDLAQAISGTVQGTHKFVPAETPVPEASAAGTPVDDPTKPPDALDMDDPVQRAVWERMVVTQQRLDEATAALARHEQIIATQQDQTTTGLIARATTSYQEAHKLTDEDMDEIQKVATRLNVVPALMSPVDPISGMPRQVDPLKALESAFDLAHWQIPRLRDKELAEVQASTRTNNQRKAKLSSLGGSSGSVPRQSNAVPTNPQERRKAMIAEMATMLNGNWINPEDS